MSDHLFATLVPLWIGIVFNLLFTVFHVIARGPFRNRFMVWYFDKFGGPAIMVCTWAFLLGLSAFNYFAK